jgi:hypothetical protein
MNTTDAARHRQPGDYEYQAQPGDHHTEINVYARDNVVINHNCDRATEHQWQDESCGKTVRRILIASVAMGTGAVGLCYLANRGCELL